MFLMAQWSPWNNQSIETAVIISIVTIITQITPVIIGADVTRHRVAPCRSEHLYRTGEN